MEIDPLFCPQKFHVTELHFYRICKNGDESEASLAITSTDDEERQFIELVIIVSKL